MTHEQKQQLEVLVNTTALTKHQIAREIGVSFNTLMLRMEQADLRIRRILTGPGTLAEKHGLPLTHHDAH